MNKELHIVFRIGWWTLVMLPALLRGQTQPAATYDPLGAKVYYFETNKSLLLRDLDTNAGMLNALDVLLNDASIYPRIDSIRVWGSSSPSGTRQVNDALSIRRAEALKTYMMWKHPYLDRNRIHTYGGGIDWQGLGALVRKDPELSDTDRESILKLLALPDREQTASGLKSLPPQTYYYLTKSLYPYLQYATPRVRLTDGTYIPASSNSPLKTLVEKQILFDTVRIAAKAVYDTIRVVDRVIVHDTVYIGSAAAPVDAIITELYSPATERIRYIALKTNLLYDIALMPNLAFEFAFGKNKRWSMEIEGNVAWWSQTESPYYCYRVGFGSVELRRWLGAATLNPLRGHYVGAYLMAGTYDLRWRKQEPFRGVQSDLSYSAGFTYGYSLRLARRLNLELGLGVGYLGGEYKRYYHSSDYDLYPWESTEQRSYFGPTKAKVALVWLIGDGMKINKQ